MPRILKQLPIPGAVDPDNDRIWCNWDNCENPASYLNRVKVCHASAPYRHHPSQQCRSCEVKCFCSAYCLDYWSHSHVPGTYGKLSPGLHPRYF